MQPLGVHHVSLNVDDVAAATAFYTEVLGLVVRSDRPDFGFDGAWLDVGDQSLMGADLPPEFAPNIDKPKNGFDVTFHTNDPAEARRVFEALAEGGKVGMPFGETFWSPGYGSLTDRFGIPWMINTIPSQDQPPAAS